MEYLAILFIVWQFMGMSYISFFANIEDFPFWFQKTPANTFLGGMLFTTLWPYLVFNKLKNKG